MGYKAQGIPMSKRLILINKCRDCKYWTNGYKKAVNSTNLYGCELFGWVEAKTDCENYEEED